MQLIDKIKEILKKEYPNAHIDLNMEANGKVNGHIANDWKDKSKAIREIQSVLRKSLDEVDYKSIVVIWPESFEDEWQRLDMTSEIEEDSNYWIHVAPDMTKYIGIVDVAKFKVKEWKYLYSVIVNRNGKIEDDTLVVTYIKEVLDFMELNDENEIKEELHMHAVSNIDEFIKKDLLDKYYKYKENANEEEKMESNPFFYSFNNLHINAKSLKQLVNELNQDEVEYIKKRFSMRNISNKFEVKDQLINIIKPEEEKI
jgi:hypothetical protein